MFIDKRISSIDIKMMMTFFRLRKTPNTPITNNIAATDRKWPRLTPNWLSIMVFAPPSRAPLMSVAHYGFLRMRQKTYVEGSFSFVRWHPN
jgi:hypothetical protein